MKRTLCALLVATLPFGSASLMRRSRRTRKVSPPWVCENMNATFIALGSAGCIFSGALLGLLLQRLLPNHHLSKETQDIVKLSAGTIATLTAMVLGLARGENRHATFDCLRARH